MASWQASGRCQSWWKIHEGIELIWPFNPNSMQLPSPTVLFLMLQKRCTNIFRWNIVTDSFCDPEPRIQFLTHFTQFAWNLSKTCTFKHHLKSTICKCIKHVSNNCEPVKSTNIRAICQVFQPVDPERYLKPWVALPSKGCGNDGNHKEHQNTCSFAALHLIKKTLHENYAKTRSNFSTFFMHESQRTTKKTPRPQPDLSASQDIASETAWKM